MHERRRRGRRRRGGCRQPLLPVLPPPPFMLSRTNWDGGEGLGDKTRACARAIADDTFRVNSLFPRACRLALWLYHTLLGTRHIHVNNITIEYECIY